MRMTFLFFIIFSLTYLISVQFTDDFSDSHNTNNLAWFGSDDHFSLLSQGIYIVLLDFFSDDVYVYQYKKLVVLYN